MAVTRYENYKTNKQQQEHSIPLCHNLLNYYYITLSAWIRFKNEKTKYVCSDCAITIYMNINLIALNL